MPAVLRLFPFPIRGFHPTMAASSSTKPWSTYATTHGSSRPKVGSTTATTTALQTRNAVIPSKWDTAISPAIAFDRIQLLPPCAPAGIEVEG